MFRSRREPDDEPPAPERVRQWRRKASVPDNELPAATGLSALLGRTGDAAVGITHLEAFSTGFQFTLAVRLRRARPEDARGGLFMLINAHPHPGVPIRLEDRLLLGLEYPDGRRASTLHDMRRFRSAEAPADDELVLIQQSGGGGDRSVDQSYWVCPLPPDGPVTVVLSWPAFGMPESRTVLDGGVIRAAATRSTVLWAPQPETPSPEPPPPPAPSTGWFAEPPV